MRARRPQSNLGSHDQKKKLRICRQIHSSNGFAEHPGLSGLRAWIVPVNKKPIDVGPVQSILSRVPNCALTTNVAGRNNTANFIKHLELLWLGSHKASIDYP